MENKFLICINCKRKISFDLRSKIGYYPNCIDCGGSFIPESKFKKYLQENPENESDEEDEDGDEDEDTFECSNCEEEKTKEEIIEFDNTDSICKKCIDKAYPRNSKIEYKEKIIEKPIIKYIDKRAGKKIENNLNYLNKSKFD